MDGSSIVEIASFNSVYKSDGGNYTCSLNAIGSATVTLHVLNGKNRNSKSEYIHIFHYVSLYILA